MNPTLAYRSAGCLLALAVLVAASDSKRISHVTS